MGSDDCPTLRNLAAYGIHIVWRSARMIPADLGIASLACTSATRESAAAINSQKSASKKTSQRPQPRGPESDVTDVYQDLSADLVTSEQPVIHSQCHFPMLLLAF